MSESEVHETQGPEQEQQSDQQSKEQQSEEMPEAPKSYSEWRAPLHKLFGSSSNVKDEDKTDLEKAGISSEGPWVSDHQTEASSEESDEAKPKSEPDPNQPVPGQPTSQTGDASGSV